jgi:uncharacterized protein YjiS (DUF1127 family)
MLTAAFIRALYQSKQAISRLATKVTAWTSNRKALRQLNELDDHMLKDLGLTRSDLVAAHAVPWHRDPYILSPFAERRRVIPTAGKKSAVATDLQAKAQSEQPSCSHLTGAAA